jgi:general L-amino acid transport system permease protein
MPIFRVLATLYVEFVRGVPLITVLFFFSIMLPLFLPGGMGISELAAIFVGYSMFSAAYMAENIRGGLQSVRKGQYEAADALGLTTVQRTSFIVLPQALRVSIPNLVGQAIATFKETSLIAIVGGFDLLRVADKSISAQPEFLGQKRPALLFISLVYWTFAYSMSRASRNLEVRLGVGQGR